MRDMRKEREKKVVRTAQEHTGVKIWTAYRAILGGSGRNLRLDAGQGDVHRADGSKALIESSDLVSDREVDGGLDGRRRGVGTLVKVAGGGRHCNGCWDGWVGKSGGG